MSIVCSIWGCKEIADYKELHDMPDGNSVYLYYCWKHKKVKDDKERFANIQAENAALKTQLTAQTQEIKKLRAVVEILAWSGCYCSGELHISILNKPAIQHKEDCIVGKAQAILNDKGGE